VPVAVNSGLFWPRRKFLKNPGKIIIEFLPPIEPGMGRKEFMAELQSRIKAATEKLEKEAGFLTPEEISENTSESTKNSGETG